MSKKPAIIFFIVAIIVCVVVVATAPNDSTTVPHEKKQEKSQYKVGQSLEGISFEEIRKKWVEESDKSEIKGTEYLNSVVGQNICWVGEIAEVGQLNSSSIYLQIKIYDGFVANNFSYIILPTDSPYRNLEKDNLVKMCGTIKSFNKDWNTEPMLSPDIANPVIEKLN